MELDDVLNGQEPEDTLVTATPEAAATPTPEGAATESSSQPRDPASGRFAPKGETQPAAAAAPAAPTAAEPGAAPPAAETRQPIPEGALIEERRKRQAAEDRVAALEAAFHGRQQQAAPQYQPQALPQIPSIYEDEDGFANGILQQAAAVARQQLEPVFAREILAVRRDAQEEVAKSRYPDYDDRIAAFVDMARANPALVHACDAAPNAAEFAYDYAKRATEVQRLGALPDLDALRAQIRAEIEAEAATAAQPAAGPQPIPTSLADSQSARVSAGAPQAPLSLSDILTGR